MKKKAQQSETTKLIVAAVVLILLLLLATRINEELSKTSKMNMCKTSIGKAEQMESKGGVIGRVREKLVKSVLSRDLECGMDIVDIAKAKLPKDKEKAADFVMEKFADAFYYGWYVTNKGEYRKFVETPNSCLLIARINMFKVSEVLSENDFLDFDKWTETHNIPGTSQTYASFIGTYGNTYLAVNGIDPRSNYYVIVKWQSKGGTPIVRSYKEQELIDAKCQVFLN